MVKRFFLCTLVAVGAVRAADPAEVAAAVSSYQKKDYKKAAEEFTRLESELPDDPQIAFYLGRIALREKRSAEAVKYLEKATRLAPENSSYFVALGEAYGLIANESRSFGTAQHTCDVLEHAVALDPKSEEARAALISFCRKAPSLVGGGMLKAYAQAKELQTLNPPAGARLLATLYENEKRYPEAFAACEETLRAHPDDYGLLYVMGRLAVGSGEHLEEGAAALEKCLTLVPPDGFPSHASAHFRLGQIFAKQSATVKARSHFEEALKQDPENKDVRAGLESLPAP